MTIESFKGSIVFIAIFLTSYNHLLSKHLSIFYACMCKIVLGGQIQIFGIDFWKNKRRHSIIIMFHHKHNMNRGLPMDKT